LRTLAAHGVHAVLPLGFEGRIHRHQPDGGDRTYAVAQFSTFALPATTADFGNGAVQLMGTRDLFAVLLEYGPESVGRKLFATEGMPRAFEPHEFSRSMARDGTGLQSAVQRFFVENGRPFTLYVVLGSHLGRRAFMAPLRGLLGGIRVAPPALLPRKTF
jgi:hypothetical protein